VSKVVFDITMSLDGFITAANQTADKPMGDDGERLHEWAFAGDERDQEVMAAGLDQLGAVICGRRTYDHSLPWWGADGPSGDLRAPVFVLSHGVADDAPDNGVYRFVDNVAAAVEQAADAAGDKVVAVMGGAEAGRAFIQAGLVDELSIHLAPVILGAGTSMFDGMPGEHLALEPIETTQTEKATHLRYRVVG
jgi:dihydrofolate reductase